MDWATAFISVLLLAQDRHLLLNPDNFVSSLSWRKAKSLDEALDKSIGAIRYTTSFFRFLTWRMLLMALQSWLWVCFEKKTSDLDLLIACPDHVQYFSKVLTRFVASFLEAFENNTMSSAYITWEMVGPLMLDLMPAILFWLRSYFINLDSTSCPKMKRYDDNGSPFLSPLLGLKQSNLPPFTITLKDAEDTQAMIQLVKISLNPKWRRIALRNLQFTLSYAFWRSSLIAIKPGLVPLVLKLWSISSTMIWFSAIHLFGMKADWVGKIILSNKGLSFSPRSFEMIL